MKQYYSIAGHIVAIETDCEDIDITALQPSLQPFLLDKSTEEETLKATEEEPLCSEHQLQNPLISLKVVEEVEPEGAYREVGDFDTGNGHTKVEKNDSTGEYFFTIRDITETPACLLHTSADYRRCTLSLTGSKTRQTFGMTSALMMCYAFAAARHRTLLIHASCVKRGEHAYAFIAKSGTGKSTQTGNWLKYVSGCELLNDDNPIVRIVDGKAYIYGSPWSGKTPCYRNIKARLGAITRIERAKENRVEKLDAVAAFASLLPSCSTMKWEKAMYDEVMDTISELVATVGAYTLHCLPDRESAEVCSRAVCAQP
ncbi:MAG: hypothetical protein HUK08_06545 [Bacteroidaceae bacterium]|nr:hypothetical protein [Bacteroidaceae bacterium]